MHVVYQPLWKIALHSLFIDRELVLSYSFKIILNILDIAYQEKCNLFQYNYWIITPSSNKSVKFKLVLLMLNSNQTNLNQMYLFIWHMMFIVLLTPNPGT